MEQQNMFMEINRKYYEAMEQQHFEIRRLKHDLANHLQVLSALPEKQRDAYLENLTENTAFTQSLSYCGDPTVNAVLTVKKNQMERYGIRMESEIDIPAKLPFDRTDICALYANALDNAVEACMKLEENKRVITLKSKAQKGLFCLEVSNPVLNSSENTHEHMPPDSAKHDFIKSNLTKSYLIPQTSKSDKANHGFGLKGIKEIAERYHGSLELQSANGIFDLFLYIPLT
ncbi:MAG: sensor histidine kinase [Lachnospiraceae bacterium]|nr:sensor histidine kinase [Lachnospiraceae bacterium]